MIKLLGLLHDETNLKLKLFVVKMLRASMLNFVRVHENNSWYRILTKQNEFNHNVES